MSLINDALKKAQKQRTGEAPTLASMPGVGGESPQRIARRAKPAGFDSLMMRAGIGGAVVLVLAIGGFFLFRDKSPSGGPVSAPAASANVGGTSRPDAAPAAPSSPAPQVSSSAAGQAKAEGLKSQVSEPASTPPPPTFTLPVAPKAGDRSQTSDVSTASGSPVPASQSLGDGRSAPTPSSHVGSPLAGGPSGQAAQVPAPVVERPKLEPRAIEFIENIKVAGIRASATDAKVLMNDRVYRPGSLVSAEFGLRLVEIASDSLTFEDDRGGRYTRTF